MHVGTCDVFAVWLVVCTNTRVLFFLLLVIHLASRRSRGLNHQIWAALGDANSIATEAITNVRTVRAFGREVSEIDYFNKSIGLALSKGIQDAIAGFGNYAITNYIDLGTCDILLCGWWCALTPCSFLLVTCYPSCITCYPSCIT